MVREIYDGNTLDFFYDQNGTPFMLLQNGNIYYYITNAQGDVIRLVDINGNTAASYRYDPYGKAISALGSHATINPLRYRGYVFDHETGLYYLQSRYYDPETGRFINADAYAATGQGFIGNNTFAYCGNNPISREDVTGNGWHILIAAAVSGTIALVSSFIHEAQDDGGLEAYELLNVLVSTTCASGEGALSAMCPSASLWIGVGSSALDSVANDLIDNAFCDPSTKKNWSEISTNAVLAATFSAAMGTFADIKIGNTSDALEQGGDLLVDSIESTIKANSSEYHPKQKTQFKQQAKGSANQLTSLFVKGSIGAQIQDIFTMWFEGVLTD